MTNIEVPQFTLGSFGKSTGKFFQLFEAIMQSSDREVRLMFSNCRKLNPFLLGGLANLFHNSSRFGLTISTEFGKNYSISSYLQTVCFSEGCDLDSLETKLESLKEKSYIPIIRFPAGPSLKAETITDQYLNGVSNLIRHQLQITSTQSAPLVYLMSELTTNINEHSGAITGTLFAQYYAAERYIDVCICDHGKGVFASYENNKRFRPRDEAEAITFAIEGKSSKDQPETRGFGISTSLELLTKGLKGGFLMWSGKHAYFQNIDSQSLILESPIRYPGTYIALRIPSVIPKDFKMAEYLE